MADDDLDWADLSAIGVLAVIGNVPGARRDEIEVEPTMIDMDDGDEATAADHSYITSVIREAYEAGHRAGADDVVKLQRERCNEADEHGEKGHPFELMRSAARDMIHLAECVRDGIEPASAMDELKAGLRGFFA